MAPKTGPKVFIGSSEKSKPVAKAIARLLSGKCDPVRWWKVFPLAMSRHHLDILLENTRECDFAVFVFSPDDQIKTRGVTVKIPRDNVLFELGLFMGTLGVDRTLVIKSSDADLHILTDLSGLMMATYSFSRDAAKLRKELEPACEQILERIRPEEFKPRSSRHLRGRDLRLYTFAGQDLEPTTAKGCELRDRSAIFRLWADAQTGGSVQAVLENERSCVRIRFVNPQGSLPGDVTIRPCGIRALENLGGEGRLIFDVRAQAACNRKMKNKPLGLAVRLLDANHTHWNYGKHADVNKVFAVPADDDWHTCSVDLKDHRRWHIFRSDGNHCYAAAQPDFSVLSAVILEVGSYSAASPGPGEGELEISNIRLEPSLDGSQ